jgi:O-methyltransferase involved in polyketide biosynthesis
MTDKIKINLGEVQKTLLIPLYGRAVESRKAHPLVVDTLAQEIVDRLDYDFDAMFARLPKQFLVNCALRAHHFDAALRALIAAYPDATIINLGAGLDTSFTRVDNGRIAWYDLDMPDSMALRERLVPHRERNVRIAKSIFDPTWYKDVKVRGSKVFLISGGVLVYLDEKEIRRLFLDLIGEFPGCEIMFETYGKGLVRFRNLLLAFKDRNSKVHARFRWAVNHARDLARWSDRISVVEEFPFYTRFDAASLDDEKIASQIQFMNKLGWMKMVRLKLG